MCRKPTGLLNTWMLRMLSTRLRGALKLRIRRAGCLEMGKINVFLGEANLIDEKCIGEH